MEKTQPDYVSYLMRLWRENADEKTVWRASLESSLGGEQRGFACLNDLFDFLRQQTGAVADADKDEGKNKHAATCNGGRP